MVAAAVLEKTYTVEEYFELEKTADIRHEFVNGKLIAMPGESIHANLIADNCGFRLRLQLSKNGYVIIRHDVRTIVKFNKIYRYPDVCLVKKATIEDTHAVTKPELLIEVTSENSSSTDHNEKLKEYTNLSSLKYYIIIAQDEPLVEVYSRDTRGWHFDIYDDLNQVITLPDLNASLLLSDIYENVVWAEPKTDS